MQLGSVQANNGVDLVANDDVDEERRVLYSNDGKEK